MSNAAPRQAIDGPYSAIYIKVVTPIEAVRRRPQMYSGTGPQGVIANIAERMAEVAGRTAASPEVRVSLGRDGWVAVEHNGIGMDVEAVGENGRWQAELWLESFGPGVWFHHLCVANVLSARIAVTTWWKGCEYSMTYAEAKLVHPLCARRPAPPGARGTRIDLLPSAEFFPDPRLKREVMETQLMNLQTLHPDVRFVIEDLRNSQQAGARTLDGVRKDEMA
jgi:DNA gyrase/topoisomerase IV subunit B